MPETEAGEIFLTTVHHSDLLWQFSYEEYDEIREKQLNLVMDFFNKYPEYGFIIDQAYVLQNYLERNPQQKESVNKWFNKGAGSLELTGGYAIPDLNLCSGESFVRNCLSGQAYYQREFDCVPDTASLMDAFGMPFQVPQVLAKLGYHYLLPGRAPNARDGLNPDKSFLWQGMGDTRLAVVLNDAGIDKSSYVTNVPVTLDETERFIKTLTDLQNTSGNILAYYMTEIQMLDEALFQHLAEVNRNPEAKRPVTFGRLADYCKTIDEKALPVYQGEFNPIFPGCYTTRIGVKQKIRAAENALFAAELAAALTNSGQSLSDAWTQLHLGQFHDAACGCHHDTGNVDVIRKLDFVIGRAEEECGKALGKGKGKSLLVLNPSSDSGERLIETTADALPAGIPVQREGERFYFAAKLPAHGLKTFDVGHEILAAEPQKRDTDSYCGKTDFFTFDFSEAAPRIQSNRFPSSVFGQSGFGEILFRHENGSMWDETLLEPPFGAEYQEERVTAVEVGPLFQKVTAKGRVKPGKKPISGNLGAYWPGFEALSFTKEYIFPLHAPYFKLRLTVDFTGCNTKVSLRIPVELNPANAVALYDTPFAATQRKPYFEVPCQYEATMQTLAKPSDYAHARGDYPALHWVDYRDDAVALAVANSGTPGHQLVGKNIFISLLRSGTRCLDGTMYPQPGSYDNGSHTFEFAFADHSPERPETAAWLGSLLNRKPVCVTGSAPEKPEESGLVSFEQENIIVSSIYPKGGLVVVRAYESFGKTTKCTMRCDEQAICYEADMRGEIVEPQDKNDILFTPFEIKTFALKKL